MRPCRWLLALAVAGAWPLHAQAAVGRLEEAGSWVVACPAEGASATCRMRYRTWILPPGDGRPSVALEVRNTGAQMVPQLALRDLPVPLAATGLMVATPTMTLRFDDGHTLGLSCGLEGAAVLCAPAPAQAAAASAELRTAREVEVHVHVALAGIEGLAPIPDQTRRFPLAGTEAAIARFRATGPAAMPLPTQAAQDQGWRGMAAQWLQATGITGGVTALMQKAQAWLHAMMGHAPKP